MPPGPPPPPYRRGVASRGIGRAVLAAEQLEDREQPSASAPDFISLESPLGAAGLVRTVPAPLAPQSEFSRLFAGAVRELIVIDRDVPDRAVLARDLVASRPAGTAVDVIELTGGGLAEVGAALARYRGLSAVHLVSHGAAGVLTVGGDRLDAATLDRFAPDLRAWGASLSAGADLLFYGCDVAASAAGRALADRVAALTGADVAASTDLTGAAALGGNWELEYRTGNVEAATGGGGWAHALGPSGPGLLVSTVGDTSVTAANGGISWAMGDAITFGGPNLVLGPGVSNGTFTKTGFNLYEFAADGAANLNGFHYVSQTVTVGGAHAVTLRPGDLVFSVAQSEVLGGVAVGAADIALFRPTTAGDYTSGTFSVLLQSPLGATATRDFALVETTTVVGGVTLNPGDFLLTAIQAAYRSDVTRYQVADVGIGTTSGTASELVDGQSSGIGFGQHVFGLELVQQHTTIGGTALAPGQLLISLSDNDNVGTNQLDVKKNDVFVLTVVATGTGTSSGSVTLLVRGTDVGLGGTNEVFDALALLPGGSNGPPVAADDSYAAAEDAPLVATAASGVLGNDADPNGDPLTASLAAGPTRGTVALNADGGFTYTPNANYFGPDSFTYTVTDGRGGTATGTVSITVVPVNDAPTFSLAADPPTVNEDAGPQAVAGFVTGMSPGPANESGQALTFQVTGNTNPGLFATGPAVAPDGTLTYTVAANASGTATVSLALRDNGGTAGGGQDTSFMRAFTITVAPVNDAPTLDPLVAVAVAEDSGPRVVALTGIGAGGGESQALVVTAASSDPAVVPNPAVSYPGSGAGGTVSFAPAADASGTATITVTVRDAGLNGFLGDADDAVTTRQFVVTVTPVPDAPVAHPDTYSTPGGVLLNILGAGVLGNDTDADGDPLTAALVGTTANGTLVLGAGGSFAYLPNVGFSGTDTFTYRAIDPAANVSAPTTVIINVALGNRAPTAVADALTVAEDTTLSGTVLGNDSDPDGDPLTVTLLTGPARGTLVLNSNGTFTFAPNADWSGTDSFAYTLSDGSGGTGTATVTLTVTPVNDPPVAVPDAATVAEDGSVTIAVRGNDTDAENDPLSVVAVTRPGNGTATTDGFSVMYTPSPDFSGFDSFTYTVSDGNGGVATATVTVTVAPVNDAPTLDPLVAVAVAEDSGPRVVALTGIGAGGGESQALVVTAASSDPAVVPNPAVSYPGTGAGGTVSFAPAADASGTATITVTVSDGLTTTSRTFVVTVTGVNDAPTITTVSAQTIPEDGALGPIAFTVGDAETPSGSLVATATSSNPALVPDANIRITAIGGGGRRFTLTPVADASGTAVITLTVSDGSASTTTTFALTVTPTADAPTAADDEYATASDTRLAVPPSGGLANDADADGDAMDAVLATGPRHGTLQLNPDGSFVYDPAPGFVGVDSFTYYAVDSTGAVSGAATVTIRVAALAVPSVAPRPNIEPARPPDPVPESQPEARSAPPAVPRLAPLAEASAAPVAAPVAAGAAGGSSSDAAPSTGGNPGASGADAPVFLTAFASTAEPDAGPAGAKPADQLPPEPPKAAAAPPAVPSRAAPPVVEAVAGAPVAAPVAPIVTAESPAPDPELAADAVGTGLDKAARDIAAEADDRSTTDAVVATAVVASAGYVLLNTRAVYWFVSALLARPAVWSRFDPIDVIYAWEGERGTGERSDGPSPAEGESLQSMVG